MQKFIQSQNTNNRIIPLFCLPKLKHVSPVDPQRIDQYFKGLSHLSCLVIGDAMIDEYLHGGVDRISPEAPVPVVKLKRKEQRLGGAANVGLNLASIGVKTMLCSLVGTDAAGLNVEQLLVENKIDASGLFHVENRPTTIKTRIMANGHHLLRVDDETDEILAPSLRPAFEEHVLNCLNRFKPQVVIFEDYDKGSLYPEIIQLVIDFCLKNKIKVTVDPKYRNFKAYPHCDLFKPNFKELVEAAGLSILPKTPKSVEQCLEILTPQMQAKAYLITLSEKGIYFKNADHQGVIPAHLRSITDVSGAGDSVIAVASTALALGLSLPELAEIANLAGGLVCEEAGVVPINKEKLQKECLTPSA
jgi:D-glycero-beta-D-manno-heptose-7-phosphate kinase